MNWEFRSYSHFNDINVYLIRKVWRQIQKFILCLWQVEIVGTSKCHYRKKGFPLKLVVSLDFHQLVLSVEIKKYLDKRVKISIKIIGFPFSCPFQNEDNWANVSTGRGDISMFNKILMGRHICPQATLLCGIRRSV